MVLKYLHVNHMKSYEDPEGQNKEKKQSNPKFQAQIDAASHYVYSSPAPLQFNHQIAFIEGAIQSAYKSYSLNESRDDFVFEVTDPDGNPLIIRLSTKGSQITVQLSGSEQLSKLLPPTTIIGLKNVLNSLNYSIHDILLR